MSKKLMLASLATLCAFASHAQTQPDLKAEKKLRFFAGIGATFGGDNLATARFTNGDTVDVRAGGVVQFHGGIQYKFADKFFGSLGAGYHVNRVNGSNGSITFSRFPIEVLGHYAVTPSVRIGAGLRLIDSAKLSSGGVVSGLNADFGSTTGAVLEGEYLINDRLGIKLRYVDEKYKANGARNSVDGSHGGVMFNAYF